jgi:hypothetical protein
MLAAIIKSQYAITLFCKKGCDFAEIFFTSRKTVYQDYTCAGISFSIKINSQVLALDFYE